MNFTALKPHQTLTEELEEVYVVAASEAWGTHESEFEGPSSNPGSFATQAHQNGAPGCFDYC